MMQKNGDVMTKVVDNFKRATPHPMTEANFEKQSEIQSDESHPYKRLSQKTIPNKLTKKKWSINSLGLDNFS